MESVAREDVPENEVIVIRIGLRRTLPTSDAP
jgi:hypothetical protein